MMELQIIQTKIFRLRGQMVMLDFDLAQLYAVETRSLNQAVKRNSKRFPEDFMFQLTQIEWNGLRQQLGKGNSSQIVMSPAFNKNRGVKYLPFAFTEHGVAMLSGMLNSQKAIETNIALIRAFIELCHYALTFDELAAKILAHDKELADISEVLRWLGEENLARFNEIKVLETDRGPALDDRQNRPRIGFKK